jgi:hypothetical protein
MSSSFELRKDKVKTTEYERYPGSGLCDVCNADIGPNEAFQVPTKVFWASKKYKEWIASNPMLRSKLALWGIQTANLEQAVDEFIARQKATDKTAHSAVCANCIHMFKETVVVDALIGIWISEPPDGKTKTPESFWEVEEPHPRDALTRDIALWKVKLAVTALARQLKDTSLSRETKIGFGRWETSFAESEQTAATVLQEQMRKFMVSNDLDPRAYDLRPFSDELPGKDQRGGTKILYMAAVRKYRTRKSLHLPG